MLILTERLSSFAASLPEKAMFLPDSPFLPQETAYHTDLRICSLPGRVVCAPSVYGTLMAIPSACVICGNSEPYGAYPTDVPYNAATVGRFLFMNTAHADSVLLASAHAAELIILKVKQGYCRCNICVVNGVPYHEAIITEDKGIAAAAKAAGIKTLTLTPGRVRLPGYSRGFIGGACVEGKDELIFFGDIQSHPEYADILAFCKQNSCKVSAVTGFPLTDFGGGYRVE